MAVYLVSLAQLARPRARLNATPAVEEARVATDPTARTDSSEGNAATLDPAPASVSKRTRKPPKATDTAPQPTRKSRSGKRAVSRVKAETAKPARAERNEPDATDLVHGLPTTVEELLHLPRAQVRELLTACNEPTRKVLLALIYRLATVEDELRSLSAKVRSAGAQALQSATLTSPARADQGSDNTGLLDQLFQKNVSLRKRP